MGVPRLLVAVTLLILLGCGVVALAATRDRAGGQAQEAAEFPVRVVGPEGALYDGSVRAGNATALSVLRLACDEAGLALEVASFPGMGDYVRAIGPYRAHGASGWIYEVTREGAVRSGDRTAAAFALHKGDALAWRWTDA